MTSLQISRNNWLESRRHQQAVESENLRHDLETERLTGEANAETQRANRAREDYNLQALAESKRAAQAKEALTAQANSENARANVAKEMENLRHDKRTEAISSFIARTDNTREWQKLSQAEQLNQSTIALNEAKAKQTDFLTRLEMKKDALGLTEAEVKRIEVETRNSCREMELAWTKYSRDADRADAQAKAQNFKNYADAVKSWSQTIANGIDIASKVGGVISKVKK